MDDRQPPMLGDGVKTPLQRLKSQLETFPEETPVQSLQRQMERLGRNAEIRGTLGAAIAALQEEDERLWAEAQEFAARHALAFPEFSR